MEHMGDTLAGDQLSSLSLSQAVAAATEIARLHAKYWGSHDPDETDPEHRRDTPSGAAACDRWCFGSSVRNNIWESGRSGGAGIELTMLKFTLNAMDLY